MSVANAAEPRFRYDSTDPFALWSEVYDEQPNPLLSLEEDFLPHLMPAIRTFDIVDLGCGTGRWLQRLSGGQPGSLTGIDSSREMLARAAAKVGNDAVLLRADCVSAILPAGCADLCLASFVASHVRNLDALARQFAHILRPGGAAFISDVHPGTATALGWTRAFRHGSQSISLQTYDRPIEEVIATLRKHGFQVSALIEPCFQPHHQQTLERHSSRLDPDSLRFPAIYILHVQLGVSKRVPSTKAHDNTLRITAPKIAFGPRATASAQIQLGEGHLQVISTRSLGQPHISRSPSVDLSGYLLLPGLINAHDHLDFGLFPKLGRGGYRNSVEWASDIQSRDDAVITAHRVIPKTVRCWWGAIRNLLSGVTTVCHHNPLSPEMLDPHFPVRVLRDFDWAHSLVFEPALPEKFRHARPETPFIIHAAEGVDSNSAAEILELDRRGLLNPRTVLVHALALNAESVSLLNRRGAAVVWCPVSNKFLFGRTHDSQTIASIHHLALGSDSALTSSRGLLHDIAAAREAGVPADCLYEMVYTNPARIFRMNSGEGTIRANGIADLIGVEYTGDDPADTLAHLEPSQIGLVVLRGRVCLVRDSLRERLPDELCDGLQPLEVAGETVWVRAPISQLLAAASDALQGPITLAEAQVRYAAGK